MGVLIPELSFFHLFLHWERGEAGNLVKTGEYTAKQI